ncbi:MAG: helix-turn-helix domain-containing protein [Chromatiales bacterium]|nr:helix-turn-helix domain-containing protein [Chromatiales bacterium]
MARVHAIRALHRGLQVLEALNGNNRALVSEVALATGLPRTTTFRLLENLRDAGYVERDDRDHRYFVTIQVRNLSRAFEDDAWVTDTAGPVLAALAGSLLWPVYLSTLFGTSMLIRATTTYASPLAIDAVTPGTLVPLLTSGAGKAYLAFCGDEERRSLLGMLAKSTDPAHAPARSPAKFGRTLREVRQRGYALDVKARMRRNPGRTTSIAVPVVGKSRVYGSLTLRYSDSAMPLARAVKRFHPVLARAARQLGGELDQRRSS